MFKVLILARRKPGVSPEAFAETFERSHIPIATGFAESGKTAPMTQYRRNYVQHGHEMGTVASGELDFDVVIECVFEDRAAFEFTRGAAERHPEMVDILMADYDGYLDPASLRYIVVEQHEGGGGAPVA